MNSSIRHSPHYHDGSQKPIIATNNPSVQHHNQSLCLPALGAPQQSPGPTCTDSAETMYPPRPSVRAAGSAASPRTNPLRSNNDRDRDDRSERRRSYDTNTPYDRSTPDSGSTSMDLQGYDDHEPKDWEYTRKLNQIIQVWAMHLALLDGGTG